MSMLISHYEKDHPVRLSDTPNKDQRPLQHGQLLFQVYNMFSGPLGEDVALFFFSSRRRHTRSTRDWSSDVCSSDLHLREERSSCNGTWRPHSGSWCRSEERRVGKACRLRWSAYQQGRKVTLIEE